MGIKIRYRLSRVLFPYTNNLFVICLIIFLLFGSILPVHAGFYTIYFYNPESNVNNFVILKDGFDSYFSRFGDYEFQPFSDRLTFENTITQDLNGVVIMSSWHFKIMRHKIPLEPVLVGSWEDVSTQKYLLCGSKQIKTVDALKNGKLASAGSEIYTRTILKEMLGNPYSATIETVTIMPVPKDIDALLAVVFGVVQFAITSEYSLTNLAEISPQERSMIQKVARSKEILMPIVALRKPVNGRVYDLLDHIENMGNEKWVRRH